MMAFALGFTCFMPYPAISIGRQSALQIGNVLTLLLFLPALPMLPWRQRPFYLFPLILIPLALSALKASASEVGDLDLCFKAILVWGISGLTMLLTQASAPRFHLHLLTGIAAATVLHVIVGAWQMIAFTYGQFPLLDLYVNLSFTSVADQADIIARYIQRPFGLFPEPSAMASSLAPFIVFWTAELCGLVRLREAPSRRQRLLFGIAAAGGLGLIIASRSGHTMITLVALIALAGLWFRRARATPHTFGVMMIVFGIIMPLLLWMAATLMSERIGGELHVGNSSWEDRSDSLAIGFSLLISGDWLTLVFGIGAGLSSPALWETARLDAVWSVTLTYIYETGLIGMVAVAGVAGLLIKNWRVSRYSLAFAAVAVVWLVGITLTTSYVQLLPIWMALGWLSVWPAVCIDPASETPLRRPELPIGPEGGARLASSGRRPSAWYVPRSMDN